MGEPVRNFPGRLVRFSDLEYKYKVPLDKDWEEAKRESIEKPPLLVFQGLRQTAFIDNDYTDRLHERKGLGRWDRYWNYGWRIRYDGQHICNSFYYPTHVALANGNIVRIGSRITPQDSKSIRMSPLGGGNWYYDQPHDMLMPDIDWWLDNVTLKYPKHAKEYVQEISYEVTENTVERRRLGFPDDFWEKKDLDHGVDNDTD